MSKPEDLLALRLELSLPLRIISVANTSEGWRAKAKRTKKHRATAYLVMCQKPKPTFPCRVILTRIGPQSMDDDNLRSAFKAVRDGIADRLGIQDNDPRVTWWYSQEYGKQYAAKVVVEPA